MFVPLNLFLFSCLAGLGLATYCTISLWWLLPAAILLGFPYLRWGFSLIFAAVWAGVICFTPPIAQPTTCHAVVYVDQFPTRRYPFGYHEFLRVINPENCPLEKGDRIFGQLFAADFLPLGSVFRANLKLTPPKNNAYIQREKFRAFATIQQPVAVNIPAPWLIRQRALIAAKIKRLFPTHQSWLQAFVIGNRTEMNALQWQALRRTGTSHLVAISGLHLTLIALVLFSLCQSIFSFLPSRWRKAQPRTLALHSSLWLTLVYALLTGGSPPVLRAWLMFLLVVISWHSALLRGRENFLSLAAVLLFLWQPWQLTSAGAWLSFLAVGLILYSQKYWHQRSVFYQLLFLQGLLTVGLLPLSWALFGGFSVMGLLANLLFIPWLSPLLLCTFLALLWPWFSFVPQFLAKHYFAALSVLARPDWAYFSPNWQPSIPAAIGLTFVILFLLQKAFWRAVICLFMMTVYSVYFTFTPAETVVFMARMPLAICRYQGETVLINVGGRNWQIGRDDAARWILPELRQHAEKPTAILLTKTGATATTALSTILKEYPATPIYSLLPAEKIPFPILFCPENLAGGIRFIRTTEGCQAEFGHWTFESKKH